MNPAGPRMRMPDDAAALVRSMHPNFKRKIKAALQTILKDAHAGKALKDELEGLRSFSGRQIQNCIWNRNERGNC